MHERVGATAVERRCPPTTKLLLSPTQILQSRRFVFSQSPHLDNWITHFSPQLRTAYEFER